MASSSTHEGQIQVIFGPMFSGKTTELIRRVRRYSAANYTCLVINYTKAVRHDEYSVTTHDKQILPAVTADKLIDVKEQVNKFEVIGIDEGQFFPDVVEFCGNMANAGKIIVVAALDGTFQQKAFGDILNLVPIAEKVVKLKAVCMQCFKDAAFSKRICAGTEIELIGGSDKYLAVCRQCFLTSSKTATPRKPQQEGLPALP